MADYIVVNGIRIASDFEPETFGRLTTIGPRFLLSSNAHTKARSYQVCECSCGCVKVVSTSALKGGETFSCGCLRDDIHRKRLTVHGRVRTVEYAAWRHIKGRCLDKKDIMYPNYGGRGIKVCDRWLEPDGRGFMNFYEDMGQKPGTKHSIDRIDVNGDYCPENCRWATATEQSRNKTTTKLITAFGETKPLIEFTERYNIPYALAYYRIQDGWEPEKALTQPKRTW